MAKKGKKKENKADKPFSPRINNKKARFNYHFIEKLETGVVLEGTEVKSLRNGKASLDEAYCRIRGGELFLLECNISEYSHGNIYNHVPKRPRKLLIHKRQIRQIEIKLNQKGLTVVPTRIYFNDRGLAKVEIAIAQGKSQSDKRDKMKSQQQERDVKRAMSRY
ncbi:MAG: SsrA-binding protein SmpB [Phycisphaerae bacterium]|nr:SsrA-binding protein SmpB [Phycisphaerae bacterium]